MLRAEVHSNYTNYSVISRSAVSYATLVSTLSSVRLKIIETKYVRKNEKQSGFDRHNSKTCFPTHVIFPGKTMKYVGESRKRVLNQPI